LPAGFLPPNTPSVLRGLTANVNNTDYTVKLINYIDNFDFETEVKNTSTVLVVFMP